MKREHIEETTEYQGHYTVDGYSKGIAWYVLGWDTTEDEDTEWTGYEIRTGKLVVVMVGDDRKFYVDPEELTEIPEDSFCRDCGQIGCECNVYS